MKLCNSLFWEASVASCREIAVNESQDFEAVPHQKPLMHPKLLGDMPVFANMYTLLPLPLTLLKGFFIICLMPFSYFSLTIVSKKI